MHVPAYWPVVLGVQAEERKGTVWEVVKSMPEVVLDMESDDMSMFLVIVFGLLASEERRTLMVAGVYSFCDGLSLTR